MAVKTLKIIFQKIFLKIKQSLNFCELLVSLKIDKTHLLSTKIETNFVGSFIF